MKISDCNQDDPRLTAYALGEMDTAERAEFEQWLRANPAAQQAVEEIRATAALLGTALAEEESSTAATAPIEAAAIIPRSLWSKQGSPTQLDGGPLPIDQYRQKRSKLLQFPALYYLTASLAAACFAVMLFTSTEYQAKEQKRLIAMDAAMADKMRASVASRQQMQARREISQAGAARNEAVVSLEVRSAPEREERIEAPQAVIAADAMPAPSVPVAMRMPSALAYGSAEVAVKLEPFEASGSAVAAADREDALGFTGAGAVARQAKEAFNTESYARTNENPFLDVAGNPLSTFSVDVDTASYANVRRFLKDRVLPPAAAVRIEELVNYFPYRYAPPSGNVPFAAHLEVASAPWAPEHRLVRIGLKGREVSDAARPRANLVFLLDVSGSMGEPNKLPLVKQSMRLLLEKLRADDRVAIVVYAGASGLALPSTAVREKAKIAAAIDALAAEGSTNGAAGIQLAYDIAKANFVSGGVNRVVLATDGDFNVGVSSEGELTSLIEEKARSGVFLSVLGFGLGNYKDSTLEQLADKGNGNYAYIDSLAEAKKTLVEQAGGTLVTIAKDVKLQVEFNPAQVQAYRLIGYENRMLRKEDFNNDKVDAGEIGAGHTVTALYEVVPVGAALPDTGAVDALKYQKTTGGARVALSGASGELLTLKVRYKEPASDVSSKLEFPLRDTGKTFAEASADFKFAAAVASFGMTLKHSPHRGEAKLADIAAWASAGTEDDAGGYRAEFKELVNDAAALME